MKIKKILLAGTIFSLLSANSGLYAQKKNNQWPNGARLVISFSMQFETGGQPEGAESPFSGSPLPKGTPDTFRLSSCLQSCSRPTIICN